MKMGTMPSNKEFASMVGVEKEVHELMQTGLRAPLEVRRSMKNYWIPKVKSLLYGVLFIGLWALAIWIIYLMTFNG